MNLTELITLSLHEDIQDGDITTQLFVDPNATADANIIAKCHGVFCGSAIISTFQTLYPNLNLIPLCKDGDLLKPSTVCVTINGPHQQILEIERALLNFLQRLSGISTTTASFVRELDDPSIHVLDTRKTTPLLRQIEKMAVVAGGGYNHRFGLYDMILVKENHLQSYINNHSIDTFNIKLRTQKQSNPSIPIEVEVTSINQLSQLSLDAIDIILFDNMSLNELNRCIDFCNQSSATCLKEVSGNITLETIKNYKGIDIDRISVGSLTHSVSALDLSLLVL